MLLILFECGITWSPGISVAVAQEEPNLLLQDANETCKAIVRHPLIRNGIEAVAKQLLAAECDAGGVCTVCRNDIVESCQRECGDMRTQNVWSHMACRRIATAVK